MEIVSKPDMNSPEEAVNYVKKIRSILRYLDTCDGNMEQGSLRADVNVSVNKVGEELGIRCEIKNLNSFKHINSAIIYEANRQIKLIESGGRVDQETRLYDINSNETRSMRSKEDAHDYRYFPDPDLLPLVLDKEWIETIKKNIPELPDKKKERFIRDYSLSDYDAEVIVSDKATSEYYEIVVNGRTPKLVTTWVTGELFSVLNKKNISIQDSPISSEMMGELIDNIENGKISNRLAKDVFEDMCETGKNPNKIIQEKGLSQISDEGEIERLVDEVLNNNPDNIEKYKNGKTKLLGFFVGEVMKLSKGKANPSTLNKLLKKKLDN